MSRLTDEELARLWLGWRSEMTTARPDMPSMATSIEILARAVLAMAPVVEAAERYRDSRCQRLPKCDPYDGNHDEECSESTTQIELCGAVDVLRGAK